VEKGIELMTSDSKLLKTKKDSLKERILNEMVVPKKEYPLSDYTTYKLSKDCLIGLAEDEALELNKKGFVSIDPNHTGGYGTPIKLFDTTNYAVTYCKYCDEDQPVSFTGHATTYKGTLNNGIFIWCDECNGLLFCLDHIANGGISS